MTEKNFSTLTLQTIANYRDAAAYAVQAYRVGGHRLADAISGGLNSSVYARADKFAPIISEQVQRLQSRAFAMTTNGIDLISTRTTRLITIGAETATAGVGRIAHRTTRIDNPYLSKSLDTAARLNLPSAKLALAISVKLAEGAEGLLSAAAGPVSVRVKTGASKVATTTRRKVNSAKTEVKSAARKAGKQATAAKTKVVRKSRAAAANATA